VLYKSVILEDNVEMKSVYIVERHDKYPSEMSNYILGVFQMKMLHTNMRKALLIMSMLVVEESRIHSQQHLLENFRLMF